MEQLWTMLEHFTDRFAKPLISLVIVVILLAQFSMIPLKVAGKPAYMWYWPIVDYPMYEEAHVEGDHILVIFFIEVTWQDGSVYKVDREDLGMQFHPFQYLSRSLVSGSEGGVDKFLSLYQKEGQSEVAEIRVYTPPLIITRRGPAQAPSKLLRTIKTSEQVVPQTLQPEMGVNAEGTKS
jgi:hypothetical protein